MEKKCPHCNAIIDHLRVAADYSEYGRAYGSKDIDSDYEDFDDIDCSDTDYYDYEYSCPECQEDVDEDDLLDVNEEDDDEKEVKIKLSKTLLGIVNQLSK